MALADRNKRFHEEQKEHRLNSPMTSYEVESMDSDLENVRSRYSPREFCAELSGESGKVTAEREREESQIKESYRSVSIARADSEAQERVDSGETGTSRYPPGTPMSEMKGTGGGFD